MNENTHACTHRRTHVNLFTPIKDNYPYQKMSRSKEWSSRTVVPIVPITNSRLDEQHPRWIGEIINGKTFIIITSLIFVVQKKDPYMKKNPQNTKYALPESEHSIFLQVFRFNDRPEHNMNEQFLPGRSFNIIFIDTDISFKVETCIQVTKVPYFNVCEIKLPLG